MDAPGWSLLSNHGHVLIAISRDPDVRVRDIAGAVGISDRAVQGIIADLEAAGYVERQRRGRRNHYELHTGLPMPHPLERDHEVGELLTALGDLGAPTG